MQKQISWNSGGGNITLTYSGSGNGDIAVTTSEKDIGEERSQVIVVRTVDGAVSKNITIRQAACPLPVGNILNFPYTGAVQEANLIAGTYKLQCWGAQGGSSAADEDHGLTPVQGGKGGYSEGILTLTEPTTMYIFTGGMGGSDGTGGWNGGGGSSNGGYSSNDADGVFGCTRYGGGGGMTEIGRVGRFVDDWRSVSDSLVAGGGSGGSMACKETEETVETVVTLLDQNVAKYGSNPYIGATYIVRYLNIVPKEGVTYRVYMPDTTYETEYYFEVKTQWGASQQLSSPYTLRSGDTAILTAIVSIKASSKYSFPDSIRMVVEEVSYTTDTVRTYRSQEGYAGGGEIGEGNYGGNAAASRGAFGKGESQEDTDARFCSAPGGAGWYGGTCTSSDEDMEVLANTGGGSGHVCLEEWNNSQYGEEYSPFVLDSGTTISGTETFEAPGGGTETGHSGHGYARITRIQ